MSQSTICLLIFALTLVGYILNKWPLALVSMTSLTLLSITGCLSPEETLASFSNEAVIVMGAMMVIAAGLSRTQMLHKLTNLVYRISGGSFTIGLLAYCLVTFAVSQLIANSMVIFSICAPLAMDYCRKSKKSPTTALFSICLMAVTAVAAMPLGSGASAYVIVNAHLANFGFTGMESHLFDFFIIKIPSLVVAVICAAFICPRLAPKEDLARTEEAERTDLQEQPPLDPVREMLGYGIFLAVVLCMLLNKYLPMTIWQICLLGALLEVLTGVLSGKEALNSIVLSPVFLLIGALGLGTAVIGSGAGEVVTGFIQRILGTDPNPWAAALVLWFAAFLVTQFMNNLALMTAMDPLVFLLCLTYGWNPIGLVYMVNTACFISYLTPLSTVAVPYMMQLGGYRQKDLLRMGWIPAVLISVTTIPWVMFLYPPC